MRWAFPVFAASFWIFFFVQWSLGRRWFEDGLVWNLLIAAGWTILAGLSWWTHPRARGRRA
ncbi:hypothetical protein [Serinicoccus marinus]|uniref:hypothetical protein n=1 Tax=Serinicoccus marinus TaxID=247333 RepID=UPI0004236B09|nr:hypothetical protein [Serinicoccus marinus]